MFLKFFLTLKDDSRSLGVAAGIKRNEANPANAYKKDKVHRTNFNEVVYSLSNRFQKRELYSEMPRNCTREILVNLADEAMFQLETLGLVEYCYCTYNIESKIIAFGSTVHDAVLKSYSDYSSNYYGSGVYVSSSDMMFQFGSNHRKEVPDLDFILPNSFYDQVLQEILPYIKYEKINLFSGVAANLMESSKSLDTYLDNYIDNDLFIKTEFVAEKISYSSAEIRKSIEMFMFDDEHILERKEDYETMFDFMGAMCLKIMTITNETF